jgi:hypothetical protein
VDDLAAVERVAVAVAICPQDLNRGKRHVLFDLGGVELQLPLAAQMIGSQFQFSDPSLTSSRTDGFAPFTMLGKWRMWNSGRSRGGGSSDLSIWRSMVIEPLTSLSPLDEQIPVIFESMPSSLMHGFIGS